MKDVLFVAIISIIALGCLNGQSKTLDLVPDFHKNNTAFITTEIHYTPSKESIEFIGLSCYHFDEENISIFYKLKTDNQWSPWVKFERQHEFVESSRSAYRTKPIYKSFSDIQFKTSEKLKTALTVRFFFAAQDKNTQPIMKRSFNCDLPEVCERLCWCSTCPIDNSPVFTEPTHLIVHHSAGNNQSNNFATVVEYIWDLHVNTNGWDDIGYNWLIDQNGILYEGRPDSFQGAHFSCINENTVGICVIGDYSLVQPAEAALNTLVDILAFEATDHAIDINAQSYHVTGDFILDNLAGHRDSSGSLNACSGTVCPGDSFYPLLMDIRQQVSELVCYDVSSTAGQNNIQDVKVFPNPIDQYLFINSDKHQIQTLEIIDLYGRSLGFVNSGKANDLSHLKAGVYFLVYEGKLVQKVIKK
ncbi:MAG: hypothetical protein ACI86M_003724 [Saprospiraceae bacterium]|jgi:hypothetical protein